MYKIGIWGYDEELIQRGLVKTKKGDLVQRRDGAGEVECEESNKSAMQMAEKH